MTTALQPDLTLDARDLYCPSPVLKAAEEMDKLAPGQLLRVLANDPAAEKTSSAGPNGPATRWSSSGRTAAT